MENSNPFHLEDFLKLSFIFGKYEMVYLKTCKRQTYRESESLLFVPIKSSKSKILEYSMTDGSRATSKRLFWWEGFQEVAGIIKIKCLELSGA
jgi:hypothetical protein